LQSSALQTSSSSLYRGRFAPSPTGELHFGSLVAAVGSYLDARRAHGKWLVRIEDVDTTRQVPGSADRIFLALETFGFCWDEAPVRQSERTDLYQSALERLEAAGRAYPCSCSRAEILGAQPASSADELRYPGWCRSGVRHPGRDLAVRFLVPFGDICFQDSIQGQICVEVAGDIGDFVIRRRDGLFAYQLAVTVDDAEQGITHVVRGADLLGSTPRQWLLQSALGLPHPVYAHLPVATDASGIKLSKSAGVASLDWGRANRELWRALRFLRQEIPQTLQDAELPEIWAWAIDHWDPTSLREVRQRANDSNTA
jgi:glutamyl-Q tRNA(Asp) synthetase